MRIRPLMAAITVLGIGAHAQTSNTAVKLELRCASCTFRQGEPVWLALDFTAATPNNFTVSSNYIDPDIAREEFIVTPQEGTSNPLAPYVRIVQVAGGSFNFARKPLSERPLTIRMDLNEWVRFDQPGAYRVSVISPRVSGLRLQSNEVAIQIVKPDADWQKEQLSLVLSALTEPLVPGREVPDEVRELCDLGTEQAAIEMARRMGNDARTFRLFEYGLIRSPFQAAGIAELQRLLNDPDTPVSEYFLGGMANVSVDPVSDPGQMVRAATAQRDGLSQKLVAVLNTKRGAALAISANTLLASGNLAPADRTRVAAVLVDSFRDLPADQQLFLLSDSRYTFTREQHIAMYKAMFEEGDVGSGPLAAGMALSRWYALDPEGARKAILAELQRPIPRFGARFLGILPDKTLPEEEGALAQHLLTANRADDEVNLAELLHRYATAAALPQVLPFITSGIGHWRCDVENAAIAYVVKVDTDAARELILRASAETRSAQCPLLSGIGLESNEYLEELAISRLNYSSPNVVWDAANYLSRHGSAASEQYVKARYQEWLAANPNPSPEQADFGSSLASFLVQGQTWFYDTAQLRQAAAQAPAGRLRQTWEQAASESAREPVIIPDSNVPPGYRLAQYTNLSLEELKDKMTQFPRGTTFRWSTGNPEPDSSAQGDPALQDFFKWVLGKGISITR